MANATLIADSFVSLAALGGLAILIGAIRRTDRAAPLNRRLIFGLHVLAVLMASRVLFWWSGAFVFSAVTVTSAGLVPLATIMLTEGLLRRHAPMPTKIVGAGGALLFLFLGLLPASFAEPWRDVLLFIYQLAGFALSGHFALTRDRSSLSRAENQAVDRIALSLLLILPLFVTDYRTAWIDPPVRLGGLAILFLCWLMISLGQRTVSHRDTLASFVTLSCVSALGGGAIAMASGMSATAGIQATAIVVCTALLGVIWKDGVTLKSEQRRQSLIRHLAEGDISETRAFLQGLQNHPLVDGSLTLQPHDLGDFDLTGLRALFDRLPVLSLTDARGRLDASDSEQLAWLLEKYDATHVILASREPFMLVALNMPALSATPGAEAELKVVQRMAFLISERMKTNV